MSSVVWLLFRNNRLRGCVVSGYWDGIFLCVWGLMKRDIEMIVYCVVW